jgi:hypothetical protein
VILYNVGGTNGKLLFLPGTRSALGPVGRGEIKVRIRSVEDHLDGEDEGYYNDNFYNTKRQYSTVYS